MRQITVKHSYFSVKESCQSHHAYVSLLKFTDSDFMHLSLNSWKSSSKTFIDAVAIFWISVI